MGFLKTEHIILDGAEKREVDMSYNVYVDKDGNFTTTIPKEWADKLSERMIETQKNKLGHPGFFSSRTLEELKKSVYEKMTEYVSRELIESKVVLKYAIRITCNYCMDENGNIFPNGTFANKYVWKSGTISTSATTREPYGFLVYVEPFMKYSYKYKSGKTKAEYIKLCHIKNFEATEYLHWLDSLCSMAAPKDQKIEEIDYDENIGLFFINIIKSIFMLNEKIKDFIHPNEIKTIASHTYELLKNPDENKRKE